jgi:hypothetical protein
MKMRVKKLTGFMVLLCFNTFPAISQIRYIQSIQ